MLKWFQNGYFMLKNSIFRGYFLIFLGKLIKNFNWKKFSVDKKYEKAISDFIEFEV